MKGKSSTSSKLTIDESPPEEGEGIGWMMLEGVGCRFRIKRVQFRRGGIYLWASTINVGSWTLDPFRSYSFTVWGVDGALLLQGDCSFGGHTETIDGTLHLYELPIPITDVALI